MSAALELPVAFQNPHSKAKDPKLRSSCDGCATAKIKCAKASHEQPKCSRCTTLGLICIYGPSRQSGKPSRKRPASGTNTAAEKRLCTAAPKRNTNRVTGSRPQNVTGSTQHDLSHPAAHLQLSSDVNNSIGFDGPSEPMADFYPTLPLQEWPQLGEWHELDNFGVGLDFSSNNIPEPARTVSRSSQETHSCPRESYEIFRDLICPTPSLHAPESNSVTVSAQLDQVLQFNRNAIDRLRQVLRCPCSKSGHRAMVHASTISRVLIWYQQAIGWTGNNNSWGPRPSTSVNPSISSSSSLTPHSPSRSVSPIDTTPSLVQATGFAVEHVPVSMGVFSIEDETMQTVFKNHLILSELKKMAGLIELFKSQDSGDSPAGGLTCLYSHLGVWLQSEHSRTVKILKSSLKSLNENLES